MALQPYLQNYLRVVSMYAIATLPSPLALAPKKDYDSKETVYPKDRYWQFSYSTFTLRPHNSYYNCKETC